jgi:hypothetical protein
MPLTVQRNRAGTRERTRARARARARTSAGTRERARKTHKEEYAWSNCSGSSVGR